MKNVLYIGWIGFGNLGDELLWNIFKDLSDHYLKDEEIKIIPSMPNIDINKVEGYDAVVLGGGSLLLPGYVAVLRKAIDLGKDVFVWGSGLDWIEKQQLDQILAGEAPNLERNFPQKDAELIRDTLARANFVGVRGPITKKVLEILGANSDNIRIIGDPGLLLKPPTDMSQKKEKVVGINWGTTFNRLYGQNEERSEDHLVQVAKKLIQSGYKIVLYVVWGSDRGPSQRFYNKINDPANVTFDQTLYTEEKMMKLISSWAFTINFKLHANILSLSAGVPCVALGYRFKVFDMFHSLGLEDYVISTGSETLAIDVYEIIQRIEKNHDQIIDQYEASKQKYNNMLIEPIKNKFKV